MGKYNSGRNGKTAKRNSRSLVAEIVALIAIVALIVTLVLVGANKGGTKTSLFALERNTYVLDGDYQISDLDFDVIGSTENNLRLSHACCIDLNGYELDLNGFALSIIPTRSEGLVTIKNGKIKNGTLLIDNDENDLTIDNVSFDSTLRYTLRTAGSTMTLCATSVQSRNIKATGGILNLENAKMDAIDLYSDLIAEGSTIGFITSHIEDATLSAYNCSIAGVSASESTTFVGNFDCPVDIVGNAVASADENKKTNIVIKDKVATLNVNTDAIVTLKRDGDNAYGATVNTLNINADNATINIMNCATVGVLNSYANATINISGKVGDLRLPGKSTVIAQKSAIVKNMNVVADATINFAGSVYNAQIAGAAVVTFDVEAYILRLDVMDTSTATVNLNCCGAVVSVYGNESKIFILRDCKIKKIIDHANGTANFQFDIDSEPLYYGEDVTDEEIEKEIKTYWIPIVYVDTTCTGDGYIISSQGGNENTQNIKEVSMKSVGHKYEVVITEKATEDKEGKGLRTCTVCGLTHDLTIQKEKSVYSPKTPMDYIVMLFDPGDYDYSLQDNSGYILNYAEDEGQSSAEGGTGVLYDVLYFKTCYIHFSVEKNKATKEMRMFGDIDIDATLLKEYSEAPDWDNIDDSKAAEAINFKLTAAIKDSTVAFSYSGPDFVFLKAGEYFMDVNDLIDGLLSQVPILPEGFGTSDLIDIIETVRKVVYYFQKYGEPFEFILEALLKNVNLSAVVQGITWIVEDPDVENGYYVSFERLAETILEYKDTTLNDYIDGVFGKGTVSSILNYAYKLPGETMKDIKSSIEAIASVGGMDPDALIDDFNILLSILLKNVINELPGDVEAVKENMIKYFGRDFDIRKALEEYGDYSIYELIYGRYVEDPASENPEADYQRYLDSKKEFDDAWGNTIATLDTVSLNTSIGTLIDSLLETFDAYIDDVTFEKLLGELAKLDKYFDYHWTEVAEGSTKGKKLASEFNLYIPKGIEYDIADFAQNGREYLATLFEYVKETVLRLTGVSSADEGDGEELINILNFKYNNKDGYFTDLKFDWFLFDEVEVTMNLTGVEEVKKDVETPQGMVPYSYYYNKFNINIYAPNGEGEDDDVVFFNVDYDEKTKKLSNLEAYIVIAECVYFTYHDYASYIESGLGIAPLEGGELKVRLDFGDGHFSGEKLVIRNDATPTDVIKDALLMFKRLSATLDIGEEGEKVRLGEIIYEKDDLIDGKHVVRLVTNGVDISGCYEYDLIFDEDNFYLEGYRDIITRETRSHYGIINDVFVKNADGKIRGIDAVAYVRWFTQVGDVYVFDHDYEFFKLGVKIENGKIGVNYTEYDEVYTDYTEAKLNSDYNSSSRTVVIGDEVFVHGAQLNSDFRPEYNANDRWRQYWVKMGDIDHMALDAKGEDVAYIFENATNVNYVFDGEIDVDYKTTKEIDGKKVNQIGANFTIDYLEWALFTNKLSDTEYNVKAYNDWVRDIDGELVINLDKVAPAPDAEDQRYKYKFVDGNFSYYRYDTKYDNYKDYAYRNWKQDGDKYVLDSYKDEGGEIYYDAEIDELYGKIIENKWIDYYENNTWYEEIVTRTKYEILDEKYDQDRRFKLIRYRYENDDDRTQVTSTEIYGMLDVIFGEEQDALQFTFGSEWLSDIEHALHRVGLTNNSRSTSEIRATGATETYQVLAYKNEKGKYNGLAIRLYDFETAFIFDKDEIMIKLDLRRFDFPINIDVDINTHDITDLSFIIQYGEKGNEMVDVNIASNDEKLDGYIEVYGMKYFSAYRDNVTGEWDYKLSLPIYDEDEGFDPDENYAYYVFSFIYKDEDLDLLWGVINRGKPEEEKSWLERILDIADHRDIIKINYDRKANITKMDFTILQIGPVNLNVNLMISDTYYEYSFSIVGLLDDDYQYATAGKNSIQIQNFLNISGNRKTGAISVYVYDLFFISNMAEEDVALLFKYDPEGDNGFSIFRAKNEVFDNYDGGSNALYDEYITVMYNLNNFTLRVVVEGFLEAIVEIDEDDPTIWNAHLWIGIINLERDFQITELEDGRVMAVSNIWNYALGIYEPSTFVIEFTTTESDGYYEVNANIEKGLGTGAYYVGQIDYKDDGERRTVFFTIVTQLKIVSNVDIYTEINENEYRDAYINIPFSYEGDGMYYDCHFNFKVSNDPNVRTIDVGEEEEVTIEQFIDKFIAEMREKFNNGTLEGEDDK